MAGLSPPVDHLTGEMDMKLDVTAIGFVSSLVLDYSLMIGSAGVAADGRSITVTVGERA